MRLQPAGRDAVSAALTEPIDLGPRRAPCRVMFGPHETNLARRREISARHVAYYARRASGGCGVIVTETASVHPSDWPYERAPLAADCGPGWAEAVAACRPTWRAAAGRARARRDAGLLGVLPVRALGAVAGAGRGFARAAHGDGGRADRRAGGRIRRRRRLGRRVRARRCRDQRRPALAAAPVPVRADQSARRRLRPGPAAAHRARAARRAGRPRDGPCARAAAVLRRAGPLGGGDPGNGRRAGRAASRAGGLSRGGARVDLLGAGDPSRPAFRAGLRHRAVPAGPGRGGRRHPGGRAGQRGGPGAGAVGAGRRGRRSGRDDQGADHRSRPGRAAAQRRGGTDPPLPAVQPGLHGPGQQESGHHLRHRAQQRP